MKLSVPNSQLKSPLLRILGALVSKADLPILQCALIRCDGETLSITGSNLEIELTATTSCKASAFELCAPGRKLADILKSLPDNADLQLSAAEQRLTLTAGKSRFAISVLPAEQFPPFDTGESSRSMTIGASGLRDCMAKVIAMAGIKDVRYYLNGVYLETEDDRLNVVASDGHRLAVFHLPLIDRSGAPVACIVPRDSAKELIKLLPESQEEVTIHLNERTLWATLPDLRFATKLIDGRFPDYRRTIPRAYDSEITVDSAALLSAIQRTIVLSNEHHAAEVSLGNGELTLRAANGEAEEAGDSIAVDSPECFSSGYSLRYLADAAAAIDADLVSIGIANTGAAAFRKANGGSGLCVVMPLRI